MSGLFFLLSLVAVGLIVHWYLKASASKDAEPLRHGIFAIKQDESVKPKTRKKFSPWGEKADR